MKFCVNCGNELNEAAIICPKCGCAVDDRVFAKTAAVPQSGTLSTLSIIGFVLSFIFCIAGLICSIIAYNGAKDSGDERSKSFSRAGIIVSSCFIGVGAITGLLSVIILVCVIGSLPGMFW